MGKRTTGLIMSDMEKEIDEIHRMLSLPLDYATDRCCIAKLLSVVSQLHKRVEALEIEQKLAKVAQDCYLEKYKHAGLI